MRYIPLLLIVLFCGCAGIEAKYQNNMDHARISHIDYLNTLILEYKDKSGKFPLQSEIQDKDIQVFITHRDIPDWLQAQAEQLPIESYTCAQLEADIENVLGRDIKIPSDPQNVATYAPNLYIYLVTKDWECVSGHLYSPTSKTENVNNQYYKYQLCNE
jgi:hypothetical protein